MILKEKQKMDRNRNIDLLKGIAILMIMICHASQVIPGINVSIVRLCGLGQLGCQMFFVASGYLMCHSADKKKGIFKSDFKKKFLGERGKSVGILLPWYFSILIYYCLTTLIITRQIQIPFLTNTNRNAIFVNLLFLNGLVSFANNNVVLGGWYIGTLVIMWLVFPLLYHLQEHNKKIHIILIGGCITSMYLLGRWKGFEAVGNNTFFYFSAISQLPCLACGMEIYFRRKREIVEKSILTNMMIIVIYGIMTMILFFSNQPFAFCFVPLAISIAWGALLEIGLDYPFHIKYTMLERGIDGICWMGRNSLYLYLTHVYAVYYIQWILYKKFSEYLSSTVLFAVLLPVCIGVAIGFSFIFSKVVSKCRKVWSSLIIVFCKYFLEK